MNQQEQAKKYGLWQNVKSGTYLGGMVTGKGSVLTKSRLAIYGFSSIGTVAGSLLYPLMEGQQQDVHLLQLREQGNRSYCFTSF
ncbi:unnamed protein product (macronuclear) [Paramecium tetraurelia]|uniref:Uncharacterized protein n=1 Tax=Paramecium tetraurelia TaxID=5888 RepID=A0E920_PARTE|nr:uncharacterized protein GSPATT00024518001 [Paramecium tetraurelia]CAK91787.1 unnamed protein product [Paramecium tetraurelia]|eukprot:XP_001459184.1 hypothetical protein (macronuclear) [Paramecium tetraurelia strain d4-2]